MPNIVLAQLAEAWEFWPVIPFIAVWLLVSWILSRLGWAKFAKRYSGAKRPSGRRYATPNVQFNQSLGSYRNTVRVVPSNDGLWFYNLFLFRAFHPPFLLPWESVKRVEELSGFLFKGFILRVDDPAGTLTLLLHHNFREVLERYRPDLLAAADALAK